MWKEFESNDDSWDEVVVVVVVDNLDEKVVDGTDNMVHDNVHYKMELGTFFIIIKKKKKIDNFIIL